MNTAEIVTLVSAVGAACTGMGALLLKLYQMRQARIEKVDLAKVDVDRRRVEVNGAATPTLIELLDEALGDNRRLRAEYAELRSDHRELREELDRNNSTTLDIAERVGGEDLKRRARKSLSDPKGVPVQREIQVHKDHVDTERPLNRTRPGRRTRDGE